MKIYSILMLVVFCSFTSELFASDFSVSGFGTISAVKTNNHSVEFIQNNRLPSGSGDSWEFDNDSVLGIQANYSYSKNIKFVGQLLSRRNHRNNYEPSIDWAYVLYKHNNNLSFRLGRFISPAFAASDYRNVNYSNLWVRPPVDFYSQATINNVDGVDVIYRDSIGDYTYQIQAYLGKYDLPFNGGSIIKFHHIAGINSTIELDSWAFRVGYMNADHSNYDGNGIPQPTTIRMTLAPGGLGVNLNPLAGTCSLSPAANLSCRELITNFPDIENFVVRSHRPFDLSNLALTYDDGTIVFQAELMHRKSESSLANAKAFYFISGYRINEFTPFIGFSAGETLTKKIYFATTPEYQKNIDAVLKRQNIITNDAPYYFNSVSKQNSVSLGVRWDFYEKMAFKLQFDKNETA